MVWRRRCDVFNSGCKTDRSGKSLAAFLLVAIAGICMTGSAFFGIKAMTIVSYISVPLIAILGITAMVMAVKTGDVPLAEKFAESQGINCKNDASVCTAQAADHVYDHAWLYVFFGQHVDGTDAGR